MMVRKQGVSEYGSCAPSNLSLKKPVNHNKDSSTNTTPQQKTSAVQQRYNLCDTGEMCRACVSCIRHRYTLTPGSITVPRGAATISRHHGLALPYQLNAGAFRKDTTVHHRRRNTGPRVILLDGVSQGGKFTSSVPYFFCLAFSDFIQLQNLMWGLE
ncbi:hypothetical protein E2C01_066295 [Portunus trituberculatus]|uniref:Uncharacterized protein n=1 Tax=Portunus trituberculatus TaxID=210409 RepID=A0A5B7HPD4_PORTR|nr:hypothetical protein [Portunus trituberculatus]